MSISEGFGAVPRRAAAVPRGWSRRAKWRLVLFAAPLAAVAACALAGECGFMGDNLWEVVPGSVYRSARLSPATLEQVIQEKRLETVVSLEGGWEERGWSKSEGQVCRRGRVRRIAIGMPGAELPPPGALKQTLDAFDHAEYPLLFHCRRGADRTGLVATLYRHLYCGQPLDEAQQSELTWRKGHLPFGEGRCAAEFFTLYRQTANGRPLREWILACYPALYARSRPVP